MSDRPIAYTPDLGDAICAEVAAGKSLRTICNSDELPDRRTVFRWRREHPQFASNFALAKEESAHAHAEDILDIADDGTNDWMQDNDPDNPGYRFNGEHVQRSKLRVDTRKWIASKLHKKYSDKVAIGGADDLPPVSVQKIERVLVGANTKD